MGIVNQGSQTITFDFKLPAKGSTFNKLNRNVLQPGIYSGLKITYVGNNVFIGTGSVVLNCEYNFVDNLQVKINFDSTYNYGVINPTTISENEILYLQYEYGEVIENYADFKHTSSGSFDFNNKNLVIIGELIYNISNNISSVSYTNRTFGFMSSDLNYSIPDNKKFYNIIDESKFFYFSGSNLPNNSTKKINIPTFSESESDLLVTNNSNTTIIKNNLDIANQLNVSGITNLTNVSVSDRLSVNKFYGRVPIGGAIAVIGVFQSTNNGGTFTSAPLPLSGNITDDGFQRCDGSLINSINSIFNGKYTPNITDDRYIQGSTSAGVLGGGGNNGNNTHTISTSNLPTHSHDISHTHTGSTQSQSTSTTSNAGSHVHGLLRAPNSISPGSLGAVYIDSNIFYDPYPPITQYYTDSIYGGTLMSNAGDHNHSYSHTHTTLTTTQNTTTSGNGGFTNTSIDIRPKYINAVYLIRVL